MNETVARRLARLRSRLPRLKLDAILISDETNVRYLSGFTGDSSALLISPADALFLTDFRYLEQAHQECRGFHIITRRDSMADAIARQVRKLAVTRLGIEARCLTVESAERLKEKLPRTDLAPTSGLVESLRAVKTPDEVAAICACLAAAEQCLDHVKPFLVPGIRELDIAAEMEYHARRLGFDGLAFPPVVAFGPRGSLPHARASNVRLKPGDPILIDWGVAGGGYVCDLTRVLFHNKIPAIMERIYRTVLEAQSRAIRSIRPGAQARRVDAAARRHIARAGFARRFGHSLGHGIGLQVHEGPTIGPSSDATLRRGQVFTIEPGIYIPGLGGVRIEDDALVASSGARVLSRAPKRLRDSIIGG